jgi:hypothetical protein
LDAPEWEAPEWEAPELGPLKTEWDELDDPEWNETKSGTRAPGMEAPEWATPEWRVRGPESNDPELDDPEWCWRDPELDRLAASCSACACRRACRCDRRVWA